ncbi:MAG: hypothetical protein WBM68_01675, partial [Woeseia sp.]
MRVVFFALIVCAPVASPAQTATDAAATEGRRISEIIDAWRARGVPFAYSTELINDSMVVQDEPAATEPQAIVNAILAPYGLTL